MNRTIFIVEDNEGVATLLRELCVELGAQPVHVRGGSEALAELEQRAQAGRLPDLVVLDLALAELDGFQVATGLRAMAGGEKVPIVIISGVYKRLPEAFETRVRPVFLPKPFEPDTIRKTVQDFLDTADRAIGIARGRFAKTNPSELFVKLFDRKATGLLEISTHETKRRLWWHNGTIRFAQSNVRAETAGAKQVQTGELTQAAFDAAVAEARQARVPLYQALATTKAMPAPKLAAALKQQTLDVALGALSMAGAEWLLTQTDPLKVPDARCEPVTVIAENARQLMSPEDAREALIRLGDSLVTTAPVLEREVASVRAAWPGEPLLGLIGEKTPLREILTKSRAEDLPFIWALTTSGLLKTAPRVAAVHVVASNPGVSVNEISTGSALSAVEKQARTFILAEHARTAGFDWYQLLGIGKSAGTDELRAAFLQLARKYHSDTYAGMELGPDGRVALSDLFQRLNTANETLNDANRRAEYDIFLTRKAEGLPTDVATVLRAEELFKRAELLIKANVKAKASHALELLDEALKLNSGDPEFHIYRAYAAFRAITPTPQAASAARDAIARVLERAPKLASAYVFLGLISRDLGADSDAVLQLEKALALDEKDEFALREVRAVRHRQGKSPEGSIFRRLFRK